MAYIYCRNGEQIAFDSKDDYVKFVRGFDHFDSMEAMVAYVEEKTHFYHAGWRRTFLDYYISDYCLDPIYDHLTKDEVKQLRAYQKQLQAEAKAADEAREWKLVDKFYWADNSVEEVYEDKDGKRKTVMVVGPHGDACY